MGEPKIVVVDYHKGNLSSVVRGLARAGAAACTSDDPEQIRRADGLDRLSKSHLVRDDGLALPEGEADPLLLVRVETGFQKAVQVLVRQFGQKALTVIRILRLRDVVKHIRVAAEVRVEFLRPYDETLQLCHLAWKRNPVGRKIFTRQKPHRGSSDRPYPDTDGAAL